MAVRKNYREYNTVSKSGTGTSSWIYLDHYPTHGRLLLIVEVTGTVNYTVEIAGTDPFAGAKVVEHYDLKSQDSSRASAWIYPAQGVRIVNNSGDGSTTLTVIESGDR